MLGSERSQFEKSGSEIWGTCLFVCPSVYFSVRYITQLWTYFDEMFGAVRRGPGNDRLEFGGYPNHDLDPGIFKELFV